MDTSSIIYLGAGFAAGAFVISVGSWIYTCYIDRRYIRSTWRLAVMSSARPSAPVTPHFGSVAGGAAQIGGQYLMQKCHIQQDRVFPSISEFEKHLSRNSSKRKDHVKFNVEGDEIA